MFLPLNFNEMKKLLSTLNLVGAGGLANYVSISLVYHPLEVPTFTAEIALPGGVKEAKLDTTQDRTIVKFACTDDCPETSRTVSIGGTEYTAYEFTGEVCGNSIDESTCMTEFDYLGVTEESLHYGVFGLS
jgi:hypothetical protein